MVKINKLTQDQLFKLFLIVIGTMMMFRPPADPDFGWHYKYGEYFAKTGTVLQDNIFSYTYSDYHWVNTYWLFEVILYFLHHTFGHIIATLLVSVLISIFLTKYFTKLTNYKPALFLAYVFIVGMLASYSIAVRPHIYSTIFMYLLLYVLLFQVKYKKWLPLLFLVWANIHADFALGLFILGLSSVSDFILELKTERSKVTLLSFFTRGFSHAWILGTCFLATFINVHGLNLWVTLLKELTLPIKSYVQEWAPFKADTFEKSVSLGFIFALFLVGALSYKTKTKLWYPLAVIFFFIFAFKAAYMARVFYITASIGLIVSFAEFAEKLAAFLDAKNNQLIARFFKVFIAVFFIAVCVEFTWKLFLTVDEKQWANTSKYPHEALAYIRANPIKGHMLNNYNWGGYLIWKLPEHKTFIDGRMTSWRKEDAYFMTDYYKLVLEPEKNSGLIDNYIETYNITWIIETPESKLVNFFLQHRPAEWETVFENTSTVILKKL